MTTEVRKPLELNRFPYDGSRVKTVVDANGSEVYEGDICVVVKNTRWLKVGALIKAIGPAVFDGEGGIEYRDTTASSSQIRASNYVVKPGDETLIDYKLALAWHRKETIIESMTSLQSALDEVVNEIDELQKQR